MSGCCPLGRMLLGEEGALRAAYERFEAQPVDETLLCEGPTGYSDRRTTLAAARSVTGAGTFQGRARRTISLGPSTEPGWWINRSDQPEQLPIEVSVRNVWTSARNIVLRSGNPHNYMRMVEHIVALRLGLGVDDLLIQTDSGDPPLFDRSSLDLVDAIEDAGVVSLEEPARYVTVREPVAFAGSRGDFLIFLPPEAGERKLRLDVAIDFRSVIGRQRVRFDVTPSTFRRAAFARTNATYAQMLAVKVFGFLFADTRHLGYTRDNILIHGRSRYENAPRFVGAGIGKALEPVWHRAALDLLAALALIEGGRFVGQALSYRAGHTLDVRAVGLLHVRKMLTSLP